MRRFVLFCLLPFAFCFLPSFALGNSLTVDSRDLSTTDVLIITVTLEGPYAELEAVPLRVDNLFILGEPWVSTEFSWINGRAMRRKVFRFRARALQPGVARVGPVILRLPDGQQQTLAAIRIDVMPDRIAGSNDAEVVLRNMLAAGREPLFVIAEADDTDVYLGEPVDVTWWLYNAATVQQWNIVSVPKLDDFWSEERPRSERPERVIVGNVAVQRLPIRRATLFPLRSGRLRVPGLGIEAAVMRRTRGGPFALFEGELVEATYTSAPIQIDVRPLPPGPPVDATGDLSLSCGIPMQRNAGPVVLTVTLAGIGNLRAANPPVFAGTVSGRVQREGGEVLVTREDDSFAMQRQWRYLIFPASSGTLELPALTVRVFDPASAQRRELRCGPWYVIATATNAPAPLRDAPAPPGAAPARAHWPWIVAAALLIAFAALLPRIQREAALRRQARAIVRDATPAEIRARVEERVQIDVREQSDRGDAWRALRSLLDAAERDRDIAIGAEREIERRVREVLTIGR